MEWKHSSVTGPEALVKFYLQIHTKPCLALISTTALLLQTRNFCSCREIVLIHLSTVSFSVREKKWMDAAGNSWNHAVFKSQSFLERQASHAITYLSFLPSFDFLPFLPTAIFRTTLPLEREERQTFNRRLKEVTKIFFNKISQRTFIYSCPLHCDDEVSSNNDQHKFDKQKLCVDERKNRHWHIFNWNQQMSFLQKHWVYFHFRLVCIVMSCCIFYTGMILVGEKKKEHAMIDV